MFGESALVLHPLDAVRTETMTVMSDTAQAFQIDRASFEMLLAVQKNGPLGRFSL